MYRVDCKLYVNINTLLAQNKTFMEIWTNVFENIYAVMFYAKPNAIILCAKTIA